MNQDNHKNIQIGMGFSLLIHQKRKKQNRNSQMCDAKWDEFIENIPQNILNFFLCFLFFEYGKSILNVSNSLIFGKSLFVF